MFGFYLLVCLTGMASAQYYGGNSIHIPVLDGNGVPTETPEVVAARQANAAAHAAELARSGGNQPHQQYYPTHHQQQPAYQQQGFAPIPQAYSHQGPTSYAPLAADGQAVDTPEIIQLKAAHFQAHAEAAARNNVHHTGGPVHHQQYNTGHYAPQAQPQQFVGQYTADVAAARDAHLRVHEQLSRPQYNY